MDFRPVGQSQSDFEEQRKLFSRCFPKATQYSERYLRWLYAENPSGPVVGFEAMDGDRLAAHYVCIPAPILIDGQERQALLSLNTATDPNYQGRGLFTKLANLTYEKASSEGFQAIIGVANANSTPGFVTKLGFQRVDSLLALIGIGPISAGNLESVRFRRSWSPQMLEWRVVNPENRVGTRRYQSGSTAFAARTHLPGLVAWTERAAMIREQASVPLHTARLFLGLLPANIARPPSYFSIPEKLRPSPLNLIYRPLSQVPEKIEPKSVYFDFLDFDPF